MRFEQTKDVLNHARDFHAKLARFYHSLADETQQERIKLLLDYFSRHEQHLGDSLDRFEDETSTDILDTWIDFSQDKQILRFPADIDIEPDMSVEQVIKIAMQLDECLIRLYRQLVDNTNVPELREIFEELLALEESEKHRVARQSLRINDM